MQLAEKLEIKMPHMPPDKPTSGTTAVGGASGYGTMGASGTSGYGVVGGGGGYQPFVAGAMPFGRFPPASQWPQPPAVNPDEIDIDDDAPTDGAAAGDGQWGGGAGNSEEIALDDDE